MASSRLEKIGTIYTRTRGLLQSGAINWADRPLWYDIYEAFPPNEIPQFDRPAPKVPPKEIFYKEDNIRALLHKKVKGVGSVNLSYDRTKSFTQRFIDTYQKLEEQYAGGADQEKIFTETLEAMNRDRDARKQQAEGQEDDISLVSAFKSAEKKQTKDVGNLNISVKDIFKD